MSDEIVPDFVEFRWKVDQIQNTRDSILVKTLYLLAARDCEIITKASPSDVSTTPYGKFLKHEIKDNPYLEGSDILLIKCPIAKRKQINREELKPYYKYVALPTEKVYEPWTLDLMEWLEIHDTLAFDFTRQHLLKRLKKNLGDMLPKRIKNPLRHFRVTHLVTEYDFDPNDLTAYTGWTVRTGFAKVGFTLPTDQLQIYQHYRWKQYLKRLLKELFNKKGEYIG